MAIWSNISHASVFSCVFYCFFLQHMIAGALAGMGEHVVMFPVDTIKTRMQALAHPGQQVRMNQVVSSLMWRTDTHSLSQINWSHWSLTHFPLIQFVNMQLHTSVTRALKAVLRREGVLGLYRGVTAMAVGAGYAMQHSRRCCCSSYLFSTIYEWLFIMQTEPRPLFCILWSSKTALWRQCRWTSTNCNCSCRCNSHHYQRWVHDSLGRD